MIILAFGKDALSAVRIGLKIKAATKRISARSISKNVIEPLVLHTKLIPLHTSLYGYEYFLSYYICNGIYIHIEFSQATQLNTGKDP